MSNKIFKGMSLLLLLILVVSCGGGKEEEEFKFYALKEAASQQLELTVEASGTVEAISSIEIKFLILLKKYVRNSQNVDSWLAWQLAQHCFCITLRF